MFLKLLVRHVAMLLLTLVAGGLVGATLVRFAPGFDTDEQQLNAVRSAASLAARDEARSGERQVVHYYKDYLWRLAHGDFGDSRVFQRPVRELLAERVAVTWQLAGLGLLVGCGTGLAAAIAATAARSRILDSSLSLLCGVSLSLPAALAAIAALVLDAPVWICLAVVIFPRVFRYTRDLLSDAAGAPHVFAARARGVAAGGVLWRHILPSALPQTIAVLGISVSTVLAADVPVEVLAGVPGIGQLAWQAASGQQQN